MKTVYGFACLIAAGAITITASPYQSARMVATAEQTETNALAWAAPDVPLPITVSGPKGAESMEIARPAEQSAPLAVSTPPA